MFEKRKNYKVYVIGHGKSYGSWIQGKLVDNMEEADVVVLTGGEDISPKLYNEPVGRGTQHFTIGRDERQISSRDAMEVEEYNKALALNKAIWGTCRGAQLICALAGGKLIQDMNHNGYNHKLHFYDGEYECGSNTLHHQMQYPYLMPKEDYKILAVTYGLSTYYLDGNNKPMNMPDRTPSNIIKEPEFVYYPKVKGLGIQGHPEMMGWNSDLVKVCHSFLNLMIEGHINKVLALNISVKDIIERAWDFKFTKEEDELYNQIIRNKPGVIYSPRYDKEELVIN